MENGSIAKANFMHAGALRLRADMRQFGGIILVMGICGVFNTLASIASLVGPNGTTASEGIPLVTLIAACLQAFFGTFAMLVGFGVLVNDKGSAPLTFSLIAITQLALVPLITAIVGLSMAANTPNPLMQPFIPPVHEPTITDVRFVGAMEILAVFLYGSGLIGSMMFAEMTLLAYQRGKFSELSASHYRMNLRIYSGLLFVAGITQTALGSYVLARFGGGLLREAPVGFVMYTIFFPEINVAVGVVQILVGFIGLLRSGGNMIRDEDDVRFQFACFFTWVLMLSLQIVTQIAYAPGPTLAQEAPTRACFFFGIVLMPAFTDAKAISTPEEITPEYFGMKEGGSRETVVVIDTHPL